MARLEEGVNTQSQPYSQLPHGLTQAGRWKVRLTLTQLQQPGSTVGDSD